MDLEVYNNLINYLLFHKYPENFITSDKQRLARQVTQYLIEQGQLLKKNKNNFDKPLRFNDKKNYSILTYEEALERRISSLIETFTDALIISSRNVTSAQELQKERQKYLVKAHEYIDDAYNAEVDLDLELYDKGEILSLLRQEVQQITSQNGAQFLTVANR
ncbi:5124_t:CDS:2, partial [Diversispora eburnea]